MDITDLYHVNVALVGVAYLWNKFGRALGLKQQTLERIRSNHLKDTECCFTEVIVAWLKGEDRPHDSLSSPNLAEVTTALESMDMGEQAQLLLDKFKLNGIIITSGIAVCKL